MQLVARRPPPRRADVERDLVLGADGPELAGRLDDDLRRGRPARAAAARAASVRASSSRSATSRRMRWEERSADRAASPCSPCSDSASSSRLASTLVSGVRSSCEASATNRRWRDEHRLGLAARGVELAEHPLERAGQLGHLVVGLGLGIRRDGSRVRAISAAALVSAAIGAIARRAIAIPAISASTLPASTPRSRNSSILLTVASPSARRGGRIERS